jgi:AcrR family transcriptional regulator
MFSSVPTAALAVATESLFIRALGATQRARMLDAMVRAVADRGYADATVADVVALAGVSRRTFYEHFADKLECFLAAYETGADIVLAEIGAQLRALPKGDRMTRLEAGLDTYLRALSAQPRFSRVLTLDVLAAGPEAFELRERVRRRFADGYRGFGIHDEDLLRALVGGIAELVNAYIVAGRAEDLPDLTPTLVRFTSAVLQGAGERRPA